MSKNIIIQTDGTPETYNDTPRIRTIGIGSGRIGWIPYSETQTGTIAINKNGTYKASDKGLMGFSRAVVKVPSNSVTGKKADGNDYTVTTDTDGFIVETKVPSEIKITTPPNNLGPYHGSVFAFTGDEIDFTGLVVTAYDGEGQSMGEVPFGELVFPVTRAVYHRETVIVDGEACSYAGDTSDWPYPNIHALTAAGMLYAEGQPYSQLVQETWTVNNGYIVVTTDAVENNVFFTAFTTAQNATIKRSVHYPLSPESDYEMTYTISVSGITLNGTPFYYRTGSVYKPISVNLPECGIPGSSDGIVQIGTILFDGDMTPIPDGSVQTVPVQWPRTGDGLVLETSYQITVIPMSDD